MCNLIKTREMQTKTTMRYHYTPIILSKIEVTCKIKLPKIWKNGNDYVGKYILVQEVWGKIVIVY